MRLAVLIVCFDCMLRSGGFEIAGAFAILSARIHSS